MENKINRCAIYTRKSSEEGLDQSFNSLDAQREASEAYILSQQHEGWELITTQYNDGGFTGGNTERPGLKSLLDDIKDKKIDTVVVYKVDRLSRSLNDFARMMDLFDQHNVSFVSITQHFNTTTAMGRLTLNILLSFAQFEREVTGERIRDKIGLSKKKGMWMGGRVPIGYDTLDRSLIVNYDEAQLVHRIFTRFIELGSMTTLCKEINAQGYRTKRSRTKEGAFLGGVPFSKTSLYKILNNRLYIGDITHKGKSYPGLHEAIIDEEIWNTAHKRLDKEEKNKLPVPKSKTPAPLKGLLFGPDGMAMTPSHSTKKGKRYRYYVTHHAQKKGYQDCPLKLVRAGDIEGVIFDQLKSMFRQPQLIIQTWKALSNHSHSISENEVRKNLLAIESLWDHLFHNEQARLLQLFIQRIDLSVDEVSIKVRSNGIDDLVHSIKQLNKRNQSEAA